MAFVTDIARMQWINRVQPAKQTNRQASKTIEESFVVLNIISFYHPPPTISLETYTKTITDWPKSKIWRSLILTSPTLHRLRDVSEEVFSRKITWRKRHCYCIIEQSWFLKQHVEVNVEIKPAIGIAYILALCEVWFYV